MPTRIKKIEQSYPSLEVIQGNARDYESIFKLLSECDAVLQFCSFSLRIVNNLQIIKSILNQPY